VNQTRRKDQRAIRGEGDRFVLDREKLLELPVGIIVPPGHSFARRSTVTLEEALCEPLVPYIRKGYADYHHWLSGVIKQIRRKPRLTTAVDGAVSLIAAVESGQGIGFAPSTFMAVAGQRVKFVRLSPAAPPLHVGYVVRAAQKSDILAKFIDALHSIARGSTGRMPDVSARTKGRKAKRFGRFGPEHFPIPSAGRRQPQRGRMPAPELRLLGVRRLTAGCVPNVCCTKANFGISFGSLMKFSPAFLLPLALVLLASLIVGCATTAPPTRPAGVVQVRPQKDGFQLLRNGRTISVVHPKLPNVEQWKLVQNDTAIAIKSRSGPHGPAAVELFDVDTGELKETLMTYSLFAGQPAWARGFED
jgi:hypothetical protein